MASDPAKGLTRAGQYNIKKGTSFQEATTLSQSGRDSIYNAFVPHDWCFGPVANGGYLSSLLALAVIQHVKHLSNINSHQLSDTLSSSNTTYLVPVLPGPVEIRLEQKLLNRSLGHFVASLWQKDVKPGSLDSGADVKLSLRAEATIMLTTARSMSNNSLPGPMFSRLRVAPADLYSRKAEGHHVPQNESGMAFYKYKPGWECYFRPGSVDRSKFLNLHPEHGSPVFDVWWKFDHDITVPELGLLADLVGPVLVNYEDVRKTHWLSTSQMSVDVVRLPPHGQPGWKWLFCRMELITNAGDRGFCDVTMTDESGNVVGLARQTCVIRPFELVGKRKSSQQTSANGAKSKI